MEHIDGKDGAADLHESDANQDHQKTSPVQLSGMSQNSSGAFVSAREAKCEHEDRERDGGSQP